MNRVVSIILAAGKGERLGGPKALLLWPSGRTFVDRAAPLSSQAASKSAKQDVPLAIAHAEARLAAESSRVLVVTRGAVVRALLAHVRPGIDLLSSDAADDLGPAGSIAFGARRIGEAEVVLLTPVDTPPAKAELTARLLERLETAAAPGDPAPLAVRPSYGGRAGHPVLIRAGALEPYEKPAPPPLRDYLRTLGARCVELPVDDPSVRIDLNTPADVMGVLGKPPRFLSA